MGHASQHLAAGWQRGASEHEDRAPRHRVPAVAVLEGLGGREN